MNKIAMVNMEGRGIVVVVSAWSHGLEYGFLVARFHFLNHLKALTWHRTVCPEL